MKMRPALLLICLCGSLTCGAQWVLDNNWSEGGRQIGASDRWEVPVALDRTNGSVVMLSAAYDSSGTAEVRWRGFSASNGSPLWTGSGFQGETPVDLRTSFFEDRWFLFSEAPVASDTVLSNVWRIRAFQADEMDTTWGQSGAVDLGFVGPWHDGGGLDMAGATDQDSRASAVGPWMVVAGAAYDSCCAHRELPALAVLSTADGTFHPDFGEAGRIVLEPDGWLVEDSVRHEWSGRFTHALIVPTTSGTPFDPPTDMRILAGGTVSTTGAFHPFVARFHFDGALDTEFGVGGVLEWTDDDALNHGVRDMRHRWGACEIGAGIELLLGVPAGEATLAAGTMHVGWMPLHGQMAYSPTEDIDPGLPVQAPLRAAGLAAGAGPECQDEQVAVGTLGDIVSWDGACHPAWWTSYGSAFGTEAYWTEDAAFDRHRVGAVLTAEGVRLYVAGTLADDTPLTSHWILSRWKEDASVDVAESAAIGRPYPNPTSGEVHWQVPAGRITCLDAVGRRLQSWVHTGGLFSATLPRGSAWLGHNGGVWQAVHLLR